ncbi:MAG: TonB-dependent receptor plug domain-containing protein [bacterium]
MKKNIFTGLFVFLCSMAYAYSSINIFVEGADESRPYNYTVKAENIEKNGYNSIPDILSGLSEINAVSRSFSKIQADISVLGGSFEQTAVFLDGVRINDPQTGHYNFDIPATILDISGITIHKKPALISGADSYSGGISIDTKKPVKNEFKYRSVYGSHNTFQNTFLMMKKINKFGFSLSGETASSAGYSEGTDYITKTFFFKAGYGDIYRFTLGFDEKDYGAYDFYTPGAGMDSREFVITKYMSFSAEPLKGLRADVYFRSHYDRFILADSDPSYYSNRHTTGTYGINLKYSRDISQNIRGSAAYNINRDEMQSSGMGNHYRFRSAISADCSFQPGRNWEAKLKFGAEKNHEGGEWGFVPSLLLEYDIMPFMDAYISYAHSLRHPNFTELYYDSPLNKGSPELKPEKIKSFNTGFNIDIGAIGFRAEGFIKRGLDIIDWEKEDESENIWKIKNIGKINTAGYTVSAGFPVKFFDFYADYTYTDSYAENSYISKYGITNLRNKLDLGVEFEILKCRAAFIYGYKNYDSRDDYFSAADIKVSRKFRDVFEVFLKGENIFNSYFKEIPGIPAAGRYFEAGITAVY